MALAIFPEAVNEFGTALYEVERYLEFARKANQLRPWLGTMVDWTTMEAYKKTALEKFLDLKDYHVEVGYNGLIISIGAAFEHLIRRIVREAVTWVNAKIDHFDRLPTTLMQQNLIRSGHALSTIAEPPVEIAYDYEAMCRNLGTCHKDGKTLLLNAEAFSINVTNINQKRITDTLSRIGVEIDWDVFGGVAALQKLFNTKEGRKTTDAVEKYLKEFVILRNRIAHSGLGIQVSDVQIDFAATFFRSFAPKLAETVEALLKKSHK